MNLFLDIRILSCCNFVTTVLDRRSLILSNLIFPAQIAQKALSFWAKGSFFEKVFKGGF